SNKGTTRRTRSNRTSMSRCRWKEKPSSSMERLAASGIDTQHLRAAPARELGDATAHIRLIPALNRRAADPVSPGQALLTDTALMRLKDLQPIRLGGSITRANARESMTEEPIALFAVILRHPQVQHH